MVIGPDDWAVFVDAAILEGDRRPESCRAELQVSVLTEDGLRRVTEAEFSLKPLGEFGVPNVRER